MFSGHCTQGYSGIVKYEYPEKTTLGRTKYKL